MIKSFALTLTKEPYGDISSQLIGFSIDNEENASLLIEFSSDSNFMIVEDSPLI
jgi:hypothetical protein